MLVKDIFPGAASSGIRAPVAFDGKLFFGACEPATGCELWTSDGTSDGTQLFKDLFPGFHSGDPRYLKVVGDDLFFRACDEATGCELWVTDGTPQRTRRAADLRPGARSSKPGGDGSQDPGSRLVASGDYLYFAADDGSGEELHAIALAPVRRRLREQRHLGVERDGAVAESGKPLPDLSLPSFPVAGRPAEFAVDSVDCHRYLHRYLRQAAVRSLARARFSAA